MGGNTLRAAVLGANDGLVSNLALVMGVSGAGLAQNAIVVTGLAGLLAGAGSMAMGEWISVQSAREQAERQLRVEADELAAIPEEEAEELRLIYQAKGLPEGQASDLAHRLIADHDTHRLGQRGTRHRPHRPRRLPVDRRGHLLRAVRRGSDHPTPAVPGTGRRRRRAGSIAASGLALVALGVVITVFAGRNAWRSGLRQLAIGLAAAGLTYGLGALLGVSLAG